MNTQNMSGINIAIIGASGYVGGELPRYLTKHPNINNIFPCSTSQAGNQVSNVHNKIINSDLEFVADIPSNEKIDAVFFATPHRVAMNQAQQFLDNGTVVIDCSPDFRIKDLATWEKWYGKDHANPKLIADAVYGLVEHNREALKNAKLIAVPGCYATAVQLATVPIIKELAKQGISEVKVFASCVSGTSGAGKKAERPELLLAQAGENFNAYGFNGHRHSVEILQGIKTHCNVDANLTFVPHLLPVSRGMFATVNFTINQDLDLDLIDIFNQFYQDDQFINVLDKDQSPQIANVNYSNYAQLGAASSNLTAFCAIDNLGKGAAGQAIQAFNLALGFGEDTSL